MAVCSTCQQEMKGADDCSMHRWVQFKDGARPARTAHFNEPDGRCHDCGIKHGNYHHPGCDAERCPLCGGQLISCGCI